jgi:hypothetical protein
MALELADQAGAGIIRVKGFVMLGLYLMLFIMLIFSPIIVNTALKQTKQDLPNKDDKKNGKGH